MESSVKNRFLILITVFLLLCGTVNAQAPVQYTTLGDFELENKGVISDCRLAYLTVGTLNADKSNVVLISTWLAGTSPELVNTNFVGPGKVFDSDRYFIIAVDAFGNGVSSSPSNSKKQPGKSFPQFTIRDMVRAQHLLLTEHLKINHVFAVCGVSMSAMAAFQWLVSYPDFMDTVIAVSGSPRMTSYDLLYWSSQLSVLEAINDCRGSKEAMKALAPLHVLQAWPPSLRTGKTTPAEFPAFLAAEREKFSRYDAADWMSQIKAIMSHDIAKDSGGDYGKIAAAMREKCLIITSPSDLIVYPQEAKSFARVIGAQTAEMDRVCGHFAFLCDQENLRNIVHKFMACHSGGCRKTEKNN